MLDIQALLRRAMPAYTTPGPQPARSALDTARVPAPAAPAATAWSRPAAVPGAIELKLPAGGRDEAGLRGLLRGRLEGMLGVFHKDPDRLREVADRAVSALEGQIGKARETGVDAVQFRLGTLRTSYGPGLRVDQTVIEVGLVRDGRVAGADAAVLGLDGRGTGLDEASTGRGVASGVFSRAAELPLDARAESDQLRSMRAALEKIKASQEAFRTARRDDPWR
jgi:hypothetical protein